MKSDITKLTEGFKNPSPEHYPVLMWFWNGDMDEAGITFQLENFREQNITQFFIHPSSGCKVEYLSERYGQLIRHAVNEAKRLGMKYWIYDEFSYPSGHASGYLLERYPECAQQEITCIPQNVNACGMRASVFKRGKFIGAQSIKEKNGRYYTEDVTQYCEVNQGKEFATVEYQNIYTTPEKILFYFSCYNETGSYGTVTAPGTKGLHGYLNVINERAVSKFLEITHEWYKKTVGDEFGKTVMGVFTDEPTTLFHFVGANPGPWDDGFEQIFEKEHGYSLIPYLYALFYEPKTPEEVKARDDYRTTVKHLYHKNFVQQYAKWCRDNNLIFTGHFGGEESLYGNVSQGDMLTGLMKMDMPGFDSVSSYDCINDKNFDIAGKLASSAAKFKGADRVLCEAYTCCTWEMGIADMKHIANRLLCLGANFIQYMGAHYTYHNVSSPFRNSVAPAHTNNYMNPQFKFYGKLGNYIAGLSALSAATKPDGKALLFVPVIQARCLLNMLDNRTSPTESVLQKIYIDAVNALGYEGIEYDLFSEELADKITVYDGYAEVFGYRYECIILPGMINVNGQTAELISKLTAHGVKVIMLSQVPQNISEAAKSVDYKFCGTPVSDKVLADGSAYLVSRGEWDIEHADLCKIFGDIIGNRALDIESDNRVYIAARSNEYCKIYFIANHENKISTAKINNVPGMKIYNATTREEAAYPVCDGRVQLTLEPYELVVVICDNASDEIYAPEIVKYDIERELEVSCEGILDPFMEFEAEGGNIFPLTHLEAYDPQTKTWEKGAGYLKFPKGMLVFRGDVYKVRCDVNFEYIPEKVFINGDVCGVKSLRINGEEIKTCANTHIWGEQDFRGEVTHLIKYGANRVEMEVVAEEVAAVFERPPYLFFSGDFEVGERDVIVSPERYKEYEGWEAQGYPYFTGTGIYRFRCVRIQGMDMNIRFEKWKKAVLCVDATCPFEVFVNNKFAGSCMWAPYEVDITDLLTVERNSFVVKLTSGLANRLDKPRTVNGIIKPMKIKFYR